MSTSADAKLLRERAARLASRREEPATTSARLDVIAIEVAHERFAVEERFVHKASQVRSVTPLPGLPSHVLGITFDAGRIYPVLDIRQWFGLPARGLAEKDPMLIVGHDELSLAFVGDAIIGAQSLDVNTIAPPAVTSNLRGLYVRGVTPEGLIVIDVERLLVSENILVGEEGRR